MASLAILIGVAVATVPFMFLWYKGTGHKEPNPNYPRYSNKSQNVVGEKEFFILGGWMIH